MPVEMSPALLETYNVRHQPITHLLVRSVPLRKQIRRAARAVKAPKPVAAGPNVVTDNLEAKAADYRANKWAFTEGFYTEQSHRELVEGWPPRSYFAPMGNILKSYDFGIKWVRGQGDPEHLDRFPALKAAYDTLRSEELGRRITELADDGMRRTCYSVTVSWATAGSSLIPHRDTVARDEADQGFMNLIIFVDGSGGEQAGGTCIINDNEYRDVVFEPTNLRNSAIFYDSAAEFFHGFKPMRSGTFRWTLNAQFSDPDAESAPMDV